MTRYDAVLFDNDGVLVAPPAVEPRAEGIRDAFAELGVADPDPDHVDSLLSGVTVDLLEEVCGVHGLDRREFWEARDRHDARAQHAEFRSGERGCYDDVAALDDLTQDLGVVSSNHHETVEFVLERFDLAAHFDTYYGREKTVESVRLKKPNPHYIERALDDLGADPESALYVGDSESDVVAARRAGTDSVFLRRPAWADVDLSVSPTYEATDLHEVVDIARGRVET